MAASWPCRCVVLCFFLEGQLQSSDFARWSALVIFVLASITDYLDGYLARVWQQTSNIGRMLDPIADKLLVADRACCCWPPTPTARIAGWSLWAAIIILCREILVSGLREYLAGAQGQRAGDAARQMEDDDPDGRHRLPAGRSGRRQDLPATRPRPASCCCGSRRIVTLYTGYDYFRAGAEAHHGRMRTQPETRLFRLGARADRQAGGGDRRCPASVETVADLLRWLKARGEEYEHALQYPEVIRVAIDHEHVDHREKIAGAREIALFPPMTGG